MNMFETHLESSVEDLHPILDQWRVLFEKFRIMKKEERFASMGEANTLIRQFLDVGSKLSADDRGIIFFGIKRFIGYNIAPDLKDELKVLEQKTNLELHDLALKHSRQSDALLLPQIASQLSSSKFIPAQLRHPLAKKIIEWMR